ncbi:MAG TPA: hypothetical protein VK889_06820 [Solirubrobacterales bacterium]|nr:hypothetical protein [Solirubrobacterales bacterium]
MPGRRLRAGLAASLIAAALFTAGAAADPALVETGNLVLRADGGFQPRTLPQRQFAPTVFRGWASVRTKDGSVPPPLRQVIVDFDRDGRLDVAGLPTCDPARVAAAGPRQARRLCAAARVGTGRIRASVGLGELVAPANIPLSLFNGPARNGGPTLIVHARVPFPFARSYAIVAPIERRRGAFRYRVVLDLPSVDAGLGAISYIGVDVGRRFSAGGKQRSYTSARCAGGVLRTHGRFSFADGTVIDGAVEKACTQR